MLRLNGIVLTIATLLAPGPTLAAPTGSIAEPFEMTAPDIAFSRYPDLVRFQTIGSPDGRTFASLADETTAAITRVETMMREVDTGWSEVIEVRVLTASDADRAEAAALIAADTRLSALPVRYRVVDRLPADRARVGFDLLVNSATAARLVGH